MHNTKSEEDNHHHPHQKIDLKYYYVHLQRLKLQGSNELALLPTKFENFTYNHLITIYKHIFSNLEYPSATSLSTTIDSEFSDRSDDSNNNEHGMFTFVQNILYKTLPCELGDKCEKVPRKYTQVNQNYDKELECPYYHGKRDKRRIPIFHNIIQKKFIYSPNVIKNALPRSQEMNYSQHYYESIYHPIFYKSFPCKRKYCEKSLYCPYYHDQQEKIIWEDEFKRYTLGTRDFVDGLKKPRYIKPSTKHDTFLHTQNPKDKHREYIKETLEDNNLSSRNLNISCGDVRFDDLGLRNISKILFKNCRNN